MHEGQTGWAVTFLRIVMEEFFHVSCNSQTDICINIDLADTARNSCFQFIYRNTMGILNIAAQGINLINNVFWYSR